MVKPGDTLWQLEKHSRAKHQILRSYLEAWLPIMSKWNRRLILVDGFAGPGRYEGGEEGSPLIMLKAFLEHNQRQLITAEQIYLFIEEREDRARHLENEIAKLNLPRQVEYDVVHGAFEEIFRGVLAGVQKRGQQLAPTFAFIDPFGYTEAPMDLTGEFLQFERCEVLIYLPLPWIARFVGRKGQDKAMSALFGSDEAWRAAIAMAGDERKIFLHDLFRDQLRRVGGVKFVRSFEIVTRGSRGGYHLFFGTGHEKGLERMKDVMWKIDPQEGRGFRDSTDARQMVLFEAVPDLSPLQRTLRKHFGIADFAIDEASRFVLETAFLPKHLRAVLRSLEKGGELEVLSVRKRRLTYPAGTKIRFTSAR